MSVNAEGRKKSRGGKFALLAAGILVLAIMPAAAEQNGKLALGVYSGWSFGLGDVFVDITSGGHTFNHYRPNFVLGAYLQHNVSESFAVQLNMNYQNCSNHWEFSYWDRQEEGTDAVTGVSLSLNGVFTVSRSAMTQFYLMSGLGIFRGSFLNVSSFFQISGGPGVKLRVKPGSATFVNLAAVFHHLLYKYGRAKHADYLKLQVGCEFSPNDSKD